MKIFVPSSLRIHLTSMRNQFYYQRNLPHWIPRGANIFVTWRLFGSLPQSCLQKIEAYRLQLERITQPIHEDPTNWQLRKRKNVFAMFDSMLDNSTDGPTWLKIPEVANVVQEAIINKYASLYKLWAYVVMSNHCHLLLKPNLKDPTDIRSNSVAFSEITKKLKGYSAREANKILDRTGMTFWQDESFDHWIRNRQEFDRVVSYIENNPVKAGLVQRPEDWCWSSASERIRRGWEDFKVLS